MNTLTRAILVAGSALSILSGCVQPGGQSAQNPTTPGATGRVLVPGSTSTIAGDAAATELQQKWGVGRQR